MFIDFKNKQTQFIIASIVILSAVTLWIRLLPMFMMGSDVDILTMVASDDPLYNLRQVEQIIANFPNYAWYDPMSLFPFGSRIYWGSFFPTLIAIVCIITGATTRPEIIATGLLIPPLMGMIMVPIMYYIGKICGDWKTGLFGAFFIAMVSGQYYYRSSYGYMDHHIAEVLFSTIFCLCYIYTLYSIKDVKIVFDDLKTYKHIIFLSIITGIAYLLGFLVMPTMLIFAMIVCIFTIFQFFIDGIRGKSSEYLFVMNIIIFMTVLIGFVLFGFKDSGINLSSYSIGNVYAYLIVIGVNLVLYAIHRYFGKEEHFKSMGLIIGGSIVGVIFLAVALPNLYQLFVVSFFGFFGQQAITNTVQEARGWVFDQAWSTFNYGFILMFGGIIVMIYKKIKDDHPHYMFVLVWSLIMLYSTWQHIRYEYYLAVPLALLSAICVSYVIDISLPDIKKFTSKLSDGDNQEENVIKEKPKNKKLRQSYKNNYDGMANVLPIVAAIVIIIGCLFAYTSFSTNYAFSSSSSGGRMNPDWKESMDWMYNNTPDTGVNYTTIYDSATFKYPPESYGVMSWWDYGHLITYIAKRIPNANPFQQGVIGPTGSANYFMSISEEEGNKVLDNDGTRYIVTDIEMDTGKFWAMATWYNSSLSNTPYQPTFLTPSQNDPSKYESAILYTQSYYLTMISRLHNFDGSIGVPQSVYYVEYMDPSISKVSLPVVTGAKVVNASEVSDYVDEYNSKAVEGHHAIALSPIIVLPVDIVPALRHYRLVHESPNNVFKSNDVDLKYVKIFEYVKGAHIKGEGLIKVPIITDTGRKFMYQQMSVNGEFIVPYSTIDNPYGVKTTGKYLVVGTGKEYDVSENDVMQGLTVE
jgi:dolichyl-phosphooligosaccharide-protein glycotransferase